MFYNVILQKPIFAVFQSVWLKICAMGKWPQQQGAAAVGRIDSLPFEVRDV